MRRLVDWISDEYLFLDPDKDLRKEGVRIYFLTGMNARIKELAEKEGIEAPEDLISHPGHIRGNIYLDPEVYQNMVSQEESWRSKWAKYELAVIQNPDEEWEKISAIAPHPGRMKINTLPAFLEEFKSEKVVIDSNDLEWENGQLRTVSESLEEYAQKYPNRIPPEEDVLVVINLQKGHLTFRDRFQSDYDEHKFAKGEVLWVAYAYSKFKMNLEGVAIPQDIFVNLGDLTPADEEHISSQLVAMERQARDAKDARRDKNVTEQQMLEKTVDAWIKKEMKTKNATALAKRLFLYFHKAFDEIPSSRDYRYERIGRFNTMRTILRQLIKDQDAQSWLTQIMTLMYVGDQYVKEFQYWGPLYHKEFELGLSLLLDSGREEILPIAVHCFMESQALEQNGVGADGKSNIFVDSFAAFSHPEILKALFMKSLAPVKGFIVSREVSDDNKDAVDFLVHQVGRASVLAKVYEQRCGLGFGRGTEHFPPLPLKFIKVLATLEKPGKMSFLNMLLKEENPSVAERLFYYLHQSFDMHLDYEKDEEIIHLYLDVFIRLLKDFGFSIKESSYRIKEILKKNQHYRRQDMINLFVSLLGDETRDDINSFIDLLILYENSEAQPVVIAKYLDLNSLYFEKTLEYLSAVPAVTYFPKSWEKIKMSAKGQELAEDKVIAISKYCSTLLNIRGDRQIDVVYKEEINQFMEMHFFGKQKEILTGNSARIAWLNMVAALDRTDKLDEVNQWLQGLEKPEAFAKEVLQALSLMNSDKAREMMEQFALKVLLKKDRFSDRLVEFLNQPSNDASRLNKRRLFRQLIQFSITNELKNEFSRVMNAYIFNDPDGAFEDLDSNRWANVDLSTIYLLRGDDNVDIWASEDIVNYFVFWYTLQLKQSDVYVRLQEDKAKFYDRIRTKLRAVLRKRLLLSKEQLERRLNESAERQNALSWLFDVKDRYMDEHLTAFTVLKPVYDLTQLEGLPDDLESLSLEATIDRLKGQDRFYYTNMAEETKRQLEWLHARKILAGPNHLLIDRFFGFFVTAGEGADLTRGPYYLNEQQFLKFRSFLEDQILPTFYPDGMKRSDLGQFVEVFIRASALLCIKASMERQDVGGLAPFFLALPQSEGVSQLALPEPDDAAMSASRSSASKVNPGGIDFNPVNMNLHERGDAIHFVSPDVNLNNLPIIRGMQPVITDITPINNMPFLLGVEK